MVLQRQKPHASIWGGDGSDTDLNWYLTDDDGNILYGFNTDKNLFGDPVEVMPFTVLSDIAYTNIMIENVTNSEPVLFKYIVFRAGDNGIFTITDGSQKGDYTIVGHADNEFAMTVGASPWKIDESGVRTMERFSSTGREGENKPDFTAPDGSNNSFLGKDSSIDTDQEDPGKLPNFFGTSAAAPHAAAVAALLLDAKNKYYNAVTGPTEEEDIRGEIPPDAMRLLLQSTSQNIGERGFDNVSGAGFIQADAALLGLANPSPEVKDLLYDDNGGLNVPGQVVLQVTVDGDYMTDETKVFLAGEELTVEERINTNEDSYYEQLKVTIPAFGDGNPEFEVYTPPKAGTLGYDGGSDYIRFDGNPVNIYVFGDAYNNASQSFSDHYGEARPDTDITPVFLLEDVWDDDPPAVANLSAELKAKLTTAIKFEISDPSFSYLSPPNVYTVVASKTYTEDSDLAKELDALGITIIPKPGSLNRFELPITVKANDLAGPTALTYGDPVHVTYTYSWDETLYNIKSADGLRDEIAKAHTLSKDDQNQNVNIITMI